MFRKMSLKDISKELDIPEYRIKHYIKEKIGNFNIFIEKRGRYYYFDREKRKEYIGQEYINERIRLLNRFTARFNGLIKSIYNELNEIEKIAEQFNVKDYNKKKIPKSFEIKDGKIIYNYD